MSDSSGSGKAVGLVIVVFVLGIALGGVGTHFWDAHSLASRHLGILQQLKNDLQLSPDQAKQVDTIINDDWTKFRNLDSQRHAEWEPKYDQVRQQGRNSIRAILTPEQRPKFEAFLKHLYEERQKQQQGQGH